ncbi:MAG: linear amide C-N hydrolase [Chlamydiia bacterium]|nr:linear amide C-N hydrolase [Chlamydiia bacterium]
MKRFCLSVAALSLIFSSQGDACTRVLYETGNNTYLVGRNMDWSDTKMPSDFWIFPRGMAKDGGVGKGSINWTSKYGSVIISIYNAATVDGMNEKGLVGNVLYLAESEYGNPQETSHPKLSLGAWLQYVLDNFETVDEAVKALEKESFTIVTTVLPNGKAGDGHLSISDNSGDSAIFEYLDGKLKIHHGKQYTVMTNSPPYDQQLAINQYWVPINGNNFLPGTISAADRFVRASFNLVSSPKYTDERAAIASVFSQMRAVSVPLGMSDKDKPNIASTLWRSILDGQIKRYYFDSVINPSVIWVDFDKVNFSAGQQPKTLALNDPRNVGGEVSQQFKAAKPFKWLAPQ